MSLILLVEDDERLAGLVKSYLEEHRFRVVVESAGYNAVRQVGALNPCLVILDVMLPGKSGMDICREIRPDYQGPIIMLTALNADNDQVNGFECGADDYITKPVEPRVLLARIGALLRRYEDTRLQPDCPNILLGKLAIDLNSLCVSIDGEVINLSNHERKMLVELAKNAGNIVSREYLFQTIYGREYDGLDRTIDVRISQLRKKLGDDSQDAKKIKTVWGKGYLLAQDAWC